MEELRNQHVPLRRRTDRPDKAEATVTENPPPLGPSLPARLPVSPVPGRVVCAAGNDIVSGHLLAARSPVRCAVHLLRQAVSRGVPRGRVWLLS